MGSNKHTPPADDVTAFRASLMGVWPSSLDKAITYAWDKLVGCDGVVSWDGATGTLSWSGTLRIRFAREDGDTVENTIAAGSKTISDGDFAYVTLNESTGTALTVATATPTADAACNFLPDAVLVLGWRKGNVFFQVAAPDLIGEQQPVVKSSTYAATITIDARSGDVRDIDLTGDATIDFTNGVDGQKILLRIRQDATGSRLITWGTMCRGSSSLALPTLSTAASALDYVEFRYNAADGKYDCMSANLGF